MLIGRDAVMGTVIPDFSGTRWVDAVGSAIVGSIVLYVLAGTVGSVIGRAYALARSEC